MRTSLDGTRALYRLPVGGEEVDMNALVGSPVKLRFTGVINDIATGERIKSPTKTATPTRA